ncbi:MAG: hypothetical protein ACOC0U_06905 [Desulfovibrionales bacterium]
MKLHFLPKIRLILVGLGACTWILFHAHAASAKDTGKPADKSSAPILYTALPQQPSIFIGRDKETGDRIIQVLSPYSSLGNRWETGTFLVRPEIFRIRPPRTGR